MKYPLPAALLAASVFVAGCNSLENPLGGFLHTGNDARVYNAETGEFEWPKDQKKHMPRPTPAMAGSSPAPERKSDGRYYDAQRGQWVEVQEERSSTAKPKKPPTPPPVLMVTPTPVGTPPPVRPPRARGIYNPSTGQIEWNDFDPAPAATPPKAKKKWYWPL